MGLDERGGGEKEKEEAAIYGKMRLKNPVFRFVRSGEKKRAASAILIREKIMPT